MTSAKKAENPWMQLERLLSESISKGSSNIGSFATWRQSAPSAPFTEGSGMDRWR
jgi:hypothetical protein